MLCLAEKALGSNMPYTIISHTNMSSVFQFYSLKVRQITKLHTSLPSHTNEPYMSSKQKYEY